MALLLTIIALPVAFLTFNGVFLDGRRRVFPVLLFLPILLFLFLTSRLDVLIGVGQSGGFVVGLLCFFGPGFLSAGFLGNGSLGLHF